MRSFLSFGFLQSVKPSVKKPLLEVEVMGVLEPRSQGQSLRPRKKKKTKTKTAAQIRTIQQ